jgi:mRNA-degrading endonuclease RelE of RelBE toxin-antitoxin system
VEIGVETPIFSRTVVELLDDESYHSLQLTLLLRPDRGRSIRGSGGLRKVRWSVEGSGKRGGIRVIYFWDERSETFYMLYVYRKSKQEDLTAQQLRLLRRLVHEEFG